MPKFTIDLPEQTLFKNVDGEPVYLQWGELPEGVIADIFKGGALIILNNCYNSAGSKDEVVSPANRLARVTKRWDSWKKGEYTITERAASMTSLMREAYVIEMQSKHDDLTESQVEAKIKATVKDVLGKDEKATFDNFLLALAKTLAAKKGETRKADDIKTLLVAKYEKAAAELEASRAKAGKVDVDLTDIDF